MVDLIIMVGLQGSGKSTIAKQLEDEINGVVISSDTIRKNSPELDNERVFGLVYERAKALLNNGTSVIIDATNITLKARRKIFENIFKGKNAVDRNAVRVTAYVVNTPIEVCRERVVLRNKDNESHKVPLEVLDKYWKSWHTPFCGEGFDQIRFSNSCGNNNFTLEVLKLYEAMNKFDQKSQWHTLTLLAHSKVVENMLIEKSPKWLYCGLFHDVGKLYTQTIGEDGNAHYYGHENVGAYELLSKYLNFFDCDLIIIVNYHMLPYNWQTEKSKEKWKGIFGDELFNLLLEFNECDRLAH